MNWTDLLTAVGLVMLLEGILPVLSPASARRAYAMLASTSERHLRTFGLISVLLGAAVVLLVRM